MKLDMRQSNASIAAQQAARHPLIKALASLLRSRTRHYQPFPAPEPQSVEPLAVVRVARIIPFPAPASKLPTRKPPMPAPPARSWMPREPITFPASQR
jgi:hypothetical protein